MSEDLKLRIALVFRAEVAETGFNHVSVVHLMKKSGIRRQTFYDNFQDKYDLLGYTIQAMMEANVESNIDRLDWEEIIAQVFYSAELNRDFYKSVYSSQKEIDVIGEISRHIAVLMRKIIKEEGNIGYLDWEGIIILVFYGIELNKKFYKSVYESQTEVDVVGEISSHIAVLLKQIIEEEGADFDQQAKDFVETFCLGLTYIIQ
ncbi:hypothetical protein BTI92_08535 [Lactobacillus delbrueckii subsp. bulgaricus]|nr:hypothetical protein [Lactobacillus delbrueckii subsp. bulgaricus]MBT9046381.1 hypothetical protein [Lactobacillus delbrueckii subsp. bulgaricus]